MKEPYRWNYNIKIKTKEGKYGREKEPPKEEPKKKVKKKCG